MGNIRDQKEKISKAYHFQFKFVSFKNCNFLSSVERFQKIVVYSTNSSCLVNFISPLLSQWPYCEIKIQVRNALVGQRCPKHDLHTTEDTLALF